MSNRIVSICDCFSLLGCEEPFVVLDGFPTETLTIQGNIAFNNLRELLLFLKEQNVIDRFNEDSLDRSVNEKGF